MDRSPVKREGRVGGSVDVSDLSRTLLVQPGTGIKLLYGLQPEDSSEIGLLM